AMFTRAHHRSLALLASLLLGAMLTGSVAAQDWNPFDPFNTQKPRAEPERPPSGAPGQYSDDVIPPPSGPSNAVDMDDLAPVMSTDGSGLPYEVWNGLDLGRLEQLIAEVDIPPR